MNMISYPNFRSDKERRAYEHFCKAHVTCSFKGNIPYIIPTVTAIGTIYDVYCPVCHEKEDITDYGKNRYYE